MLPQFPPSRTEQSQVDLSRTLQLTVFDQLPQVIRYRGRLSRVVTARFFNYLYPATERTKILRQ